MTPAGVHWGLHGDQRQDRARPGRSRRGEGVTGLGDGKAVRGQSEGRGKGESKTEGESRESQSGAWDGDTDAERAARERWERSVGTDSGEEPKAGKFNSRALGEGPGLTRTSRGGSGDRPGPSRPGRGP